MADGYTAMGRDVRPVYAASSAEHCCSSHIRAPVHQPLTEPSYGVRLPATSEGTSTRLFSYLSISLNDDDDRDLDVLA
jgi:hypothetical protein